MSEHTDQARQAIAIGNAISRLHREHYGRGATTTRTIVHRNHVVSFLEDIYTRSTHPDRGGERRRSR